jgi:EAL domain-containing protein (putative c-di-GMP-specific phosphodiesterase class I)
VETEEQRRFLEQQQCPLIQGFLLARPMPVDEVEPLLAAELAPT